MQLYLCVIVLTIIICLLRVTIIMRKDCVYAVYRNSLLSEKQLLEKQKKFKDMT